MERRREIEGRTGGKEGRKFKRGIKVKKNGNSRRGRGWRR